MQLDSVMKMLRDISATDALTYAPSFGIPQLRKTWQDSLYQKNPTLQGQSISLPVVSAGITHGISVFADLWVDPGDAIILPEPMWGNYNMIFSVRKGASIAQYPVFTEDGRFNLGAFASCLRSEATHHAKVVVVLNFPHNPSGYTVSRKEAEEIVRIIRQTADGGTNVVVALDDSYFGLFYEEETLKESVFALLSGVHPRVLAVKLDGCTKENFAWGLRVGFITYVGQVQSDPAGVYEALEKKTAGCVRGSISNACHLSQSILLKSMASPNYPAEKAEKFEILKGRAQRIKQILADPKFSEVWEPYPFNSGYFMCVKLKRIDAETVRRHLLDRYGVGLIAIGERNLRVAFSCVEEQDLSELFDTVYQGVKDLQG